ncbi:snake venom 5'-nucleotidase-like [Amphiura filiformis]|uniref:snake venom 5'-nucleotidase-like n=1 Tax=Amphiura filiformis TaxID=82378 RepID=UPI003B20E926
MSFLRTCTQVKSMVSVITNTCSVLLLFTSLINMVFASHNVDFDLTILHTNDIHVRYEEIDAYGGPCTEDLANAGACFGGYARRVTKVKEIRNLEDNVLLLDAGDRFLGNPAWFDAHDGLATAHFMNRIGYNASVLGAYDFIKGITGVLPFLNNITFPVVLSNIDSSQESRIDNLYVTDHVLEFTNGEKVGIVGYLWELTANYKPVGGIVIESVIDNVQAAVDSLISSGVNKIIAIGHNYEHSISVASMVRGVDVVVSGTNDTFFYTGEPPSNENPGGPYPIVVNPDHSPNTSVLVVSGYRYGKYLGYLNVGFNDEGEIRTFDGNPILLDDSISQDPDALAEVQEWKPPVEELENEVVGDSCVQLYGLIDVCDIAECNLANLLTDAMVWEWNRNSTGDGDAWADVTMGMTNIGSLYGEQGAGPITFGDIRNWLIYGDTFHLVDLKGKHVVDTLEHSASVYESEGYGWIFLHVSGMRIVFDMTKPVGNRVQDVQVLCRQCDIPQYEPLENKKYYRMVMSSYILGGGDGQDILRDNAIIKQRGGRLATEVVRDYLRANGPVTTGLEGRIVVYDSENQPPCPLPTRPKKKKGSLLTIKFVMHRCSARTTVSYSAIPI